MIDNEKLREIEARLEATSVIPLASSSNPADLVFINHAKRDIRALLDTIDVPVGSRLAIHG